MFQEPLDPRVVGLRRYIQSDHVELVHEARPLNGDVQAAAMP